MLSSNYKIPDGKLVKIKLWIDSDKIERVTILGDFFLHPEEVIEIIEDALVGLDMESITLLDAITDVLQKTNATLIGASAEDLVEAIMIAWNSR